MEYKYSHPFHGLLLISKQSPRSNRTIHSSNSTIHLNHFNSIQLCAISSRQSTPHSSRVLLLYLHTNSFRPVLTVKVQSSAAGYVLSCSDFLVESFTHLCLSTALHYNPKALKDRLQLSPLCTLCKPP